MRRIIAILVLVILSACAAPDPHPAALPPAPAPASVVVETVAVVRHPSIPTRPSAIPASREAYRVYSFELLHYSRTQQSCLDKLWIGESHWNPRAGHPAGSYGIPQADPGSKMRTDGADWLTDGRTQVRWGLGYIKGRYGYSRS